MFNRVILLFFLILLNVDQSLWAENKPNPKKDYVITISTEFGNIILLLYDQAPLHKENFVKLTKEGFYNGTTFHRIIDKFMIQGGDPLSKDSIAANDGTGGPGYTIPAEIIPGLTHKRGAVAAARKGDNINRQRASSGSQFYIVQNHEGTPHLDNAYTVFGQIVQGLDVVDVISTQLKDSRDRPLKNITLQVSLKKMRKKKIIKKYHCEDFYTK
jgi:cyclophilin family peptidyl-prolyl cis-trans isomerase